MLKNTFSQNHYDWFFITGSTFPFVPKWLMTFAVIVAVYVVIAWFYLIYWLATKKSRKQETVVAKSEEAKDEK